MISYRRADIIDKIKNGYRAIYFFGDNRSQIKYYNPTTDTLSDPKKDISTNFEEMFGSTWRKVNMDGCIVLIDGNVGSRMLGHVVMEGNAVVGHFDRISVDGQMCVRSRSGENIFIDPTEYVITVNSQHRLSIERNPV